MSANGQYAIETIGLTKRFGEHVAVDHLSMKVSVGSVYAFLGRNGAGKTTTIRMLLDLLDKTSGEARVQGLDSVRDALDIKRRTGYVAEGQKMYDWMKIDEIIWFCKQFYPDWNDASAGELKHRFELDGGKRVGDLSRGTQAKLALLLALSYRPPLLILDEPMGGLDVIVRRDFLEGVIELTQDDSRTVFFSSHQVNEVERVADWVGIIHDGRLVCSAPVEEIKRKMKRVVMTFDAPPKSFSSIPGVLACENGGRQSAVTVREFSDATLAAAKALGARDIDAQDLSLESIFVALVGGAEVA